MSDSKFAMTVQKPYEATIGTWNMKYQKPYQGTVDSKNLKHGSLYKGTVRPHNIRPKIFGRVPDRTNPYRYYKLPPDYYGVRRQRNKPLPFVGREVTKNNPGIVQVQPNVSQRTEHRDEDRQIKAHPRPPVTAATTQRPQKDKSQVQRRKPIDPISPFPPASPEPVRSNRRNNPRITPDPVGQQSFGVTKPEPIFPPLMPVSLEDYVRTERTRKALSPRVRGNPLIPVKVPALDFKKSDPLRYSRPPASFSMRRDSYHDSLSRSFTKVPGYNAVGSILRSLNISDYY